MSDWVFDKSVANTFAGHALHHIPNYLSVLQKSYDYINTNYSKDARVIDVGCAVGGTLRLFKKHGFSNLYGVDNSQAMLDKIDDSDLTLINSNTFPSDYGLFDAVLCNWTLHFMKNKQSYLQNIYNNLNRNGVLILSEKVSLDPQMIGMYHDWKLSNGVPLDEIKEKEQRLKNSMFINDVSWYQQVLMELGFEVFIIDAHWCFATFLCKKT